VNRVGGIDWLYNLVYEFVALLWPMWMLAVIEHNFGPVVAAIVAVGANLLLFLALGCLTGALARRSRFVYGTYVLASVLLFVLYARWSVNLLTPLGVIAFVAACSVYAIPFTIARCLALRSG
jgi:hypothetical protein